MTNQLGRPPRRAHRRTVCAGAALGAMLAAAAVRERPVATPAADGVGASRIALARTALQDFPPAVPALGRIVYTRQHTDVFDMFTADPDGTNEVRLSDISESAAGEDQPRWSPDGTRVSFATFRDGAAVFHIVDAAGGVPRTVVERDGAGGDAAWSPDGRCLVYNGGRPEDETMFDLKVWCDDGSALPAPRNLTDTPQVDERDPGWSPDGSQIAFVAIPVAPRAADRWSLQSIRPDGTDRRTLLALPDEHIRFPRFHPDGDRIGFIGNRQNLPFGTLTVLDLVTGARERLCELASDTWSWSPDGSEILFANISNGGVRLSEAAPGLVMGDAGSSGARGREAAQYKGLYRIDVASRSVGRLAGAAGGALAPNSPTNFEFGFMPDWTAGTAAPSATPTATVAPTDPPAGSPSPSASPSLTSAPLTPSPTATVEPTPRRARGQLYLPRLFRTVPPNRRQ